MGYNFLSIEIRAWIHDPKRDIFRAVVFVQPIDGGHVAIRDRAIDAGKYQDDRIFLAGDKRIDGVPVHIYRDFFDGHGREADE